MTMNQPPAALEYAHVVVPLDGSSFAERALAPGQVLAAAMGAGLFVVSVAEDEVEANWMRQQLTQAGLVVDGGDVRVVVSEEPARAILEVTAELAPSLVCLASHGRGRVAGAVLGSVAASIVGNGGQPAVILGPNATGSGERTEGPVLACVDGSAPSETVLPVAARWARALDRPLAICTVAEPTPTPNRPEATGFRAHGPDHPEAYLDQLVATWTADDLTVEAVPIYNPISPADGMERFLRERPVELVALTTHARTGVERLALGSSAAGIIHGSPAPVLAVPIPD